MCGSRQQPHKTVGRVLARALPELAGLRPVLTGYAAFRAPVSVPCYHSGAT